MLALLLTLSRLMLFDPVASSWLAAAFVGEPRLGAELVATCRRESHCRLVGAHEQDSSVGSLMRRKALAVGWLDPACEWHDGSGARFSTRGAHGMSAAYTLRFVGDCLPPEVLDVPIVSALAAARRMQAQCKSHGACTRAARHRMWMGASKYDRQRNGAVKPSAGRAGS
jgi:hypothetical protein